MENYKFNPEKTKWGEVQYYIQDIIGEAIKETSGKGCDAKEFMTILCAYYDFVRVLADKNDEMIVK
jgi:hypothetical protein